MKMQISSSLLLFHPYNFKIIITLLITTIFLFKLTHEQCSYPIQRCICSSPTPYCPCSFITSSNTLNTSSSYYSHLILIPNFGCRPCGSTCRKCLTIQSCIQCFDEYELIVANGIGTCVACPINCKTCKNFICQNCIDQYYLDYQNKCQKCPLIGTRICTIDSLRSCQLNYWMDNNGAECVSCDQNCRICSSTTKCSRCNDGYYLNNFKCTVCLPMCKTCNNGISCIQCLQNGYYYNSNQSTCISCPSNCLTCNNNGTCIQCNYLSNYVLVKSTSTCILSSSIPIITKQNCINITYTSSTSLFQCQSCFNGYYQLKSSFNNTLTNQKCFYSCSILCKSCTGGHYGLCEQCINDKNFVYFNRNCIPNFNINDGTAFQIYYNVLNNKDIFMDVNTVISPNSCWNQYVKGGNRKISIKIQKLAVYKIKLQWKIYKYNFTSGSYISNNQSYSVSLSNNNNNVILSNNNIITTTQFFSQVCQDRPLLSFSSECTIQYSKQCISKNSITFQSIITQLNNIITFTSNNSYLAISQLLIIGYRCGGLYGDGCSECTDINTCTKCTNSAYFILNQKCVIQCPFTHYTYIQEMKCYQICPIGSYSDDIRHVCNKCIQPCEKCYSETKCITCTQGYYYNKLNKQCENKCPDKYYGNDFRKVCERCVYPCLKCKDNLNCQTCRDGFLQITMNATTGQNDGRCVLQCKQTYFGDLITVKCQKCYSPCSTCNSLGDYCLSCIPNYYLYKSSCLSLCPIGYYNHIPTLICQKCPSECQSCINITYCLSCFIGFYYYDQQYKCVNDCPDGYFEDDVMLKCQKCNEKCRTCKSEKICSSCNNGFYYYEENYQCVENCPEFYYQDQLIINSSTKSSLSIKQCSRCQLPCYTCKSLTDCLSCYDSFLSITSCTLICPKSTFANVTSLSCQPCNLTLCLQCKLRPDYCTKCQQKLLLTDGKCFNSCPDRFYFSQYKNQCILCEGLCGKCKNATYCTQCVDGYMLVGDTGKCVWECPVGQYKYIQSSITSSSITATCLPCQNNCKQCQYSLSFNKTICLLCKSQYVFFNYSCFNICPDGYFNYSNICYQCLDPCKKCNKDEQCTQCQQNMGYLYQGTCVNQCPYGYYQNGKQCVKCGVKCLLCDNGQNQCTVCIQKYYLQVKYNNYVFNQQCITTCSPGYFQSITDLRCHKCSSNCLNCINYQSNCLSCSSPLYLFQSTCVQNCPLKYYKSLNSSVCIKCPLECKSCYNETNCLSCSQNYYLSKNTCVSKCFYNEYSFAGKCRQCIFPCSTCMSQQKCLSCLIGLYYSPTYECLSYCPQGSFYQSYYNNSTMKQQQKCTKCEINCSRCTSIKNCLTCSSGQLYDGICVRKCPDGYYDYYGNCVQCDKKCSICKNSSTCEKCKEGHFYESYCYDKCPNNYIGLNVTLNSSLQSSQQSSSLSSLSYLLSYQLICSQCSNNCKQCIISPSSCIQCYPLYYLYLSQCLLICPSGSFPQPKLQQCLTCVSPCQTCSNSYSCQTCIYGYILYRESQRNQCVQGPYCPNSYYLNLQSNICQYQCPQEYYMGQEYKTCSLKCMNQTVKYQKNKTCLEKCPKNMWVDEMFQCKENIDNNGIKIRPDILPELKCHYLIVRNRLVIECNANVQMENVNQLKTNYLKLANQQGQIQKIYFVSDRKFYVLIENITKILKDQFIVLEFTKKYFLIAKTQKESIVIVGLDQNNSIKNSSSPVLTTSSSHLFRPYPMQTTSFSIFISSFTPYSIQQREVGMSFYQIAQSISYGALVIWFFCLIKNIKSTALLLLTNLQWLFSLSLLSQKSNYSPNFNQFLEGFKTAALFGIGMNFQQNGFQQNFWMLQSAEKVEFWAIDPYYQFNTTLSSIYIIFAIFFVIYLFTLVSAKLLNYIYPQITQPQNQSKQLSLKEPKQEQKQQKQQKQKQEKQGKSVKEQNKQQQRQQKKQTLNESMNKLQKKFIIINQRFIYNYFFQLILYSTMPIMICLNIQLIRSNISGFIIGMLLTLFLIIFNIVIIKKYISYNKQKHITKQNKPLRSSQFFYISHIQLIIHSIFIIWSSFSFYIGLSLISIILKIVSFHHIYHLIQPKRCYSLQIIQLIKGVVLLILVIGQMKFQQWTIQEYYYYGFVEIVIVLIFVILCLISVAKELFGLETLYKIGKNRSKLVKVNHKDKFNAESDQNVSINAKLIKNTQQNQQNQQYYDDDQSDLQDQQSFFTYCQPAVYSQDQDSSQGDIIDFDEDSIVKDNQNQLQDANFNYKGRRFIEPPPKQLFRYDKNQQNQNNQMEENQQDREQNNMKD